MTKEQYLKVIERIIKSPRGDSQKIIMLQHSFGIYVEDNKTEVKRQVSDVVQDEIESVRHNFPFTHDDEVKLDKLIDLYDLIDSVVKG